MPLACAGTEVRTSRQVFFPNSLEPKRSLKHIHHMIRISFYSIGKPLMTACLQVLVHQGLLFPKRTLGMELLLLGGLRQRARK